MKDFGVSAVCSTPNYFLYLVQKAEEAWASTSAIFPLRAGAFIDEPWSDAMRRRIEESAGIKAYNVYGLAEILGPGHRRRVLLNRTVCTSSKTTSIPRSSTPTPATRCPDGRGRPARAHHAEQRRRCP